MTPIAAEHEQHWSKQFYEAFVSLCAPGGTGAPGVATACESHGARSHSDLTRSARPGLRPRGAVEPKPGGGASCRDPLQLWRREVGVPSYTGPQEKGSTPGLAVGDSPHGVQTPPLPRTSGSHSKVFAGGTSYWLGVLGQLPTAEYEL